MQSAATQVKERPILFSGPMVRAILEERKTQTRRVLSPQPVLERSTSDGKTYWLFRSETHKDRSAWPENGKPYWTHCPYGEIGSRLWVRETFWERPYRTPKMMREGADTWPKIVYDADENEGTREQYREWEWDRKPSIFMFRHLSRIALEIVRVRVERLQEISISEVLSEGFEFISGQPAGLTLSQFSGGWDRINGKRKAGIYAWAKNPWVWVIEFKKL
jgi:hypothetical protein